ncbi:hypothetical protein BpHYR1_028109 [Brachionus plicatilis]|uniref:Uncharacterized protein n=1 Tax=Brachionus plicatilis TaxID=10195 RepID=A0A3M7R998_BRAPC|nr:hypothetical protein BpHYR1_028109 [Brachionus plicatilis]
MHLFRFKHASGDAEIFLRFDSACITNSQTIGFNNKYWLESTVVEANKTSGSLLSPSVWYYQEACH